MTKRIAFGSAVATLLLTVVLVKAVADRQRSPQPEKVTVAPSATETPMVTSTPLPTLEASSSAAPTSTPVPTKKPTPKPSPSLTPTPKPTEVPLSDVAEIYFQGTVFYEDGSNTMMGQAFSSSETKTVVDPIRWIQVSFANKGGKPAKDIDVTVYLDGKEFKKSTTSELGAGANTSVTYEGGLPTEPNVKHSIRVVLNEGHKFTEQTYDNNSIEVSYIRQ
ncbi:hypothetical protein KBD71_02925 [Candidatus Woesebacteria bacterium]|nr:hypothetical protein [Candidatus Woesebacteria bacterium]